MQMASPSKLILLLLLPFLLSTSSIANNDTLSPCPSNQPEEPLPGDEASPGDVNKWCDTVPYPESCKFFMSKKPGVYKPKEKSEFRRMIVEVALDRALAAQSHAWRWGQKCESHQERAAWADCVRLYDHTIIQLNQTLQGLISNPCSSTDFDAQTWLSSALTNLQTCRIGSDDMNVTSVVWPHVSYNVSDLISNVLAVNGRLLGELNYTSDNNSTSEEEYPSWLTHEDRRLLLSRRSLAASKAMFIVAKDRTGQYKTIQAAIDAAGRSNIRGRKVIFVKKGIYRENINVDPHNNDIMMIGQGMRYTIVTSKRSARSGYTTYNSATAGIDGLRFMARDITFQNNAGPAMGQAVALRSGSDLSVFYKCAFYGYQDTLFVHSQRQFYKMCYIFGTIDIIFGNAAVVFQSCMIYARKPVWGQGNVITAQGRADPNQNTGIVIHNSRIMAADDLAPMLRSVTTYLGRPWQQYSRTIIMKSYLGPLVNPEGWLDWHGRSTTLYYAEFGNFGPGAKLRNRVKWPSFHIITSPRAVSQFTVGSFIAGRTWLPSTGVPFSSGL